MNYRLAIFLCLLCSLAVRPLCADPAGAFLAARQGTASPLLGVAQFPDVVHHPGAYAGRTLDVAATVSGLVMAGDDRTALLSVGGEAVPVPIPAGLTSAAWLDSGARVRVLLQVAPDDAALPSGLRLLSVAPEGDVVAAEQRLASEQQRLAALARQTPLASRSLPLRTGRGRVTWVADPANAGHPAGALPAPRPRDLRAIPRPGPALEPAACPSADVDRITTSVLYFSDQNDIDPRLVVATIIAESDFDVFSTSRAGAMGLAQIMPDEARSLGVTNAYDPVQNIGAATRLLRSHLDKYGGAPAGAGIIPLDQIALTMAAYNAGPGAVHKYHGVPPYRETQRYVARIQALYKKMCGT